MSDNSAIEWTDATWNPVRGCVKVSPGCAHCYAETFAERFRGVNGHPYEQGFDLRLVPSKLAEPLSWKKPRRVFVNSMSDLFQDGVPDEYIDQVFGVMASAGQHTFQVLTKRAHRLLAYMRRLDDITRRESGPRPVSYWYGTERRGWPLPNVWLGVSVENQHFADERIPLLLQTPAAVRFMSAEPLLEHIDLTNYLWTIPGARLNRLHWIIVGGESGHGARPFDLAWARWLVAQGKSSGVPVFVKQLGSNPIETGDYDALPFDGAADTMPFREPLHLRSRKGGDMDEWPSDLRVREFAGRGEG